MIYTIGHSTLGEGEFASLLLQHSISHLLDIRSHPGSGYVPHFNRENLAIALHEYGISYCWYPSLGGWTQDDADWHPYLEHTYGVDVYQYSGQFPKQRIARKTRPMPDPPCWTNQGLYDYSFFMALDKFQSGARQVADRYSTPSGPHCAIMCAEVLWWKCHRSMVADYITHVLGQRVQHLQPRLQDHDPRPRIDRYSPVVRSAWTMGESVLRSDS